MMKKWILGLALGILKLKKIKGKKDKPIFIRKNKNVENFWPWITILKYKISAILTHIWTHQGKGEIAKK